MVLALEREENWLGGGAGDDMDSSLSSSTMERLGVGGPVDGAAGERGEGRDCH